MSWTEDKIKIAYQMKRAGATSGEIGSTIGKTAKAVRGFFNYYGHSPEEREIRLQRIRAYRREHDGRRPYTRLLDQPTQYGRPTPEMLAERDYLFSLPRTITADLCGDPLPGRSALERRTP